MPSAKLSNFVRGVPVSRTNRAQIITRHAVQSVHSHSACTRALQQFVKWLPHVTPVQVKANTFPEFLLANFAPHPLVQDMLVTRKHSFQAQDDRSLACARELLNQLRGVALRGR